MEEEREIPERERLQMEHIRELDSEELQVEEADDDDEEDDYEASASGEPYDISLAALHSYLGDVEDTNNRLAFLDGGALLTLPLFYLEGVVLFPEAKLPLRVIFPEFIAGVERAMEQEDAPNTIGVVRVYRDPNQGRIMFSSTGTTAEIRQYRRLEDGSINVVARGQQRFRLRRRFIDSRGALCGEVHIIQEDVPLRTPREAVDNMAPFRNSQTCSVSKVIRLNGRQRNHENAEEGNNSEWMFEGSCGSEHSLGERRLHNSGLPSTYSSGACDESISSDDEKFEGQSEFQPKRYISDKRALSDVQPCYKVELGKYSISHVREASKAFWPNWVYRMYDSYSLARKVADRWKQVVKTPSMDSFVLKPDLFSFHIASKIPVSESTRQELLEIDGTSYRLRREIELLEHFDKLRCKTCQLIDARPRFWNPLSCNCMERFVFEQMISGISLDEVKIPSTIELKDFEIGYNMNASMQLNDFTLIARRSDMLVMSIDGPLGAYANPHGFVHEVMTLMKTNAIAVRGRPVKEFSWFPGYAWSITECTMCGAHMGWYFSATNKKLKPQGFWGVKSSQVVDDTGRANES